MPTTEPLAITYPAELPITERREELLATIAAHQVVIVAGETGSGKSTQLPKLCLELGRGTEGLIGHTQPRRIAARSVAERVAAELGGTVGELVGYTVRFTDEVGPTTRVKVMTDGILLAAIQRDRDLRRYDTIIIDEAHERSLNIDFLLGYLAQLLPRRPDLKVIITSATIDTERFAAHFGGAPVVTVSGRTHPVEIRYRPLDDPDLDEGRDQPQAICDAVRELVAEGPGDILVFCSGEREIRDAADALHELDLTGTEVLPLYARLSAADQHRVFAPHRGRRIVVATNVAETSLTVPGVRYVVDPGTARISRFNRRTKVQRLPIEPISQASANQRAGRCGRLGPGICIRLYAEDDFADRPPFTEPEIQRTNLASVILQMAAIGLGDIEAFPFLEPPDRRAIRDGIALLEELDAVDPDHAGTRRWLTPVGRKLAALPVDPRIGRMVLEADRYGSLREVLIIAAGLSILDPRERPQDKREEAAAFHRRFDDDASDFLSYLHLWEHLRSERGAGSSSRFRRLCKREFLNYPRVREWQDVHAQLRQIAGQLELRRNREPAYPDDIHRALLAGLLSQVGTIDPDAREYRGARGVRFAIAGGSAAAKRQPRWVMAAELVETNRLWARTVARIRPEWLEEVGDHLLKRSWSDPWWEPARGAAVAHESATLYGLPVIRQRTVGYDTVDPVVARAMFIDHALVRGEWESPHEFVAHNTEVLADAAELQTRLRAAELGADEIALARWYDDRLPATIGSRRAFDSWWKKRRRRDPGLLDLTLADLIDPTLLAVVATDFPDEWPVGDLDLELTYVFDPTSAADGVNVQIPVAALPRIPAAPFSWHVPGRRADLVEAFIRTLPKAARRALVPVPEHAAAILPLLDPTAGSLPDALAPVLARRSGLAVEPTDLDPGRLPAHLRIHFRVHDEADVTLGWGDDLSALRVELVEAVRASLTGSHAEVEREGLTEWSFGDLPRRVEVDRGGIPVVAFPSLVDAGDTVAIRLHPTPGEQRVAMWQGTRRLLMRNRPSLSKLLRSILDNDVKLVLVTSPYASPTAWFDDVVGAAVDATLAEAGGPVWTEAAWDVLLARVRAGLPPLVDRLARRSIAILAKAATVERRLAAIDHDRLRPAVDDMAAQLGQLVYEGFVSGAGARHLADIERYVDGIGVRLDNLPEKPDRDRSRMGQALALEAEVDAAADELPAARVEELGWLLQELRIALFAESLGTTTPVSPERIRKLLRP